MTTPFGDYFKQLRLNQGKTLRRFCLDSRFDPGNISRLECGLSTPPKETVLKKYALALGLKPDTVDWVKFFTLAQTASGHIPKSITSDKELMAQLPVLFMTINKKKPSAEQLRNIIKLLQSRRKAN
ncbi:MAG: helix-turn-helix domain-containing protein [Elusimicrobia bacterium]|nr:helix-turn-helix domain-containing protein [Elusimicrobiota bacterium]